MSFSSAAPSTTYLTNLGLGYAIAIAFGFLVLVSSLLLASYICCRAARFRSLPPTRDLPSPTQGSDGVILPRIIFVAEDEDDPDRDAQSAVVGLDQSVINSYPKFVFSKERGVGNGNTVCSICLSEYKESEMLRMMPECRHFFHMGCVDAWLKLNGSCPVCRNSPLPTPLATPLQEVVPLAQYAADRRRR